MPWHPAQDRPLGPVNEKPSALRHSKIVAAGNLHKEVVRMLAVNDGQSIGSFARLKQLWITAFTHRR